MATTITNKTKKAGIESMRGDGAVAREEDHDYGSKRDESCRLCRSELLEAEQVHSIVGGFLDVYNYFGYGMSERVYSGSLACELRDRGHAVVQELSIDIRYKGRHVPRSDSIWSSMTGSIIENKATEKLCPADRMQLLSYLRATGSKWAFFSISAPQPRFERYIDYPKRYSSIMGSGTPTAT